METFVLVSGAWLGAWAWERVAPILEKSGYRTCPVTLTGMGELSESASKDVGAETAVSDVLRAIDRDGLDDVVLVGHSFAGKVVAAAADRIPSRINTLVFLDAIRPGKLRTPQGGMDQWPEEERESVLEECRKNGDGWRFPLTAGVLDQIGRDVVGEDRRWMLSKVTPLPIGLLRDSITLSEKYDSIRKAYVFCTDGGDDIEEIKKEKLDGPSRIIESGHWPMITKPGELAEALLSFLR